ncbi:hypothetical protein AB3G45_13410 [Shinella sp. S4-D37]|uniref:hypothetical protein n=1 Tax=Shinella sp. S4-D37 TaxID=3161999 RepID=UPI003467A06D
MKKTLTIALASLLAAAPAASVAYAQDATMPMTSDSMSTGSIAADDVNVVTLSSLEADDSKRGEAERLSLKANDPITMEKVQAELQGEPGLVEALTAKNVQLQNVIEIQTAGDGGKVVYVK